MYECPNGFWSTQDHAPNFGPLGPHKKKRLGAAGPTKKSHLGPLGFSKKTGTGGTNKNTQNQRDTLVLLFALRVEKCFLHEELFRNPRR